MRDVCGMKTVQRRMLLAALPWLAAAPAAAPAAGTPVALASRPGTPLDAMARSLVVRDLQEAAAKGERPLVLVGSARLGAAADRPALFVQLQSPRECGSAGCSTTVHAWIGGRYQQVLDGVAGRVAVATTRHKGMADLVADTDTYVWNGAAYVSRAPAPSVDLRPRRRRPAG